MNHDARQQLLAVNVGAESWKAWEDSVRVDGLPDEEDLFDTFEEEIEEPKHVLKDLLRVGQVGALSGGSKTFKSWTVGEIALAVAGGGKFMKWKAYASGVYYIDTELQKYDFMKRLLTMAKQKGIQIDSNDIRTLRLRGENTSIDDLIDSL